MAEQYIKKLVGGRALPGQNISPKDIEAANARDWTLVQELDAMDYFAAESARIKKEKQRRLQNVSDLQAQADLKNRHKDDFRDLSKKWREEAETDAAQWKKEEQDKKARSVENQKEFNEARRQQLEAHRMQLRKEREADKRADEEMSAANKEGQKREERNDEMKKQKRKEMGLEMYSLALRARQDKEKAKQKEHSNDVEMAHKAQELLDAQDTERKDKLKERKDKLEAQMDRYQAEVGNKLEAEARAVEERALKQMQALNDKVTREKEKKERKLQQMRDAGKAAVAQQLEEHEVAKLTRADEDRRFYEAQQAQAMTAVELDEAKKDKKKQAREEHADYLRRQIREKAERKGQALQRDQMDEVERNMNKEKLKRAMDPERADGLQMLFRKKRMEYRIASQAA